MTPDQVETAFVPAEGLDLPALQAQARQQAGRIFSEAQLAHSERLPAERDKIERYYRQQELAVKELAETCYRLRPNAAW